MSFTILHPSTPGEVWYAYPFANVTFLGWMADRIELTDPSNVGLYSGTALSSGPYGIFRGSAQPTSWDQAESAWGQDAAEPTHVWSGALLEADRTYPWLVRYPSSVENPSLAIRLNGVVAETVSVSGSGQEHVFPVLIPPYAERGDTVMVETTESTPRPVILGQVIRTINSMSLGQGSFRVRVEVEDGVAPVDGAVVNILDSNEDPIGVYGRTVNGGVVEFNLDPGAYRAVITSMSGFQPHSPVPFAVVDESVVVNLLFERFNVTEAEDPELCNVYAVVRNIDGTPSVGSPVVATVEGTPPMLDGSVISSVSMSANTDGNGIARLTLIRSGQFVLGGRYEITAGDRIVRYWVPDQSAAILTLDLAVPQ